jgi:conjugal transfer/entry exclusion protein
LPEATPYAWVERAAAHLLRDHPVLSDLDVAIEHLCGVGLAALSGAQLDAAEAFHTAQLRAIAAAQLAAAVAHARAEAAEETARAAMLRDCAL